MNPPPSAPDLYDSAQSVDASRKEQLPLVTLPDFLQPLERLHRSFPHEAMQAAIARREESIPHLLHALEWVQNNVEEANESDPPYFLHLFALFLLAQLREERAYETIVRLARHPAIDDLIGDTITEDLYAILAAVSGGETRLIEELIEDDEVNEWVRGAAVHSLGALVFADIRSRAEISSYLGALLADRLSREPSHVWDATVAVCVDLRLAEHLDVIRRAYRDGLADQWVDRLEDVEKYIVKPPRKSASDGWGDRYTLIDDAITAMKSWSCFQPERARNSPRRVDDDDASALESEYEPPESPAQFDHKSGSTSEAAKSGYEPLEPTIRDAPKIGRNDKCPCGSGRKYKKCCGRLGSKA